MTTSASWTIALSLLNIAICLTILSCGLGYRTSVIESDLATIAAELKPPLQTQASIIQVDPRVVEMCAGAVNEKRGKGK